MKLQFLGTGTLGCRDRALTSFLIDDELLLDIGNGTVRQLQLNNIDAGSIKYLVITHFHADHLLDVIHLLAKRVIQGHSGKKLVIIGPKGIEQIVFDIMSRCFDNIVQPFNKSKGYENVEFHELTNDKIQVGDYEIAAHDVIHGVCNPCSGYEVKKDNIRLGFSGDSSKCDGLDEIVENSDINFVDTTRMGEGDNSHLNINGAVGYAKSNPNKKFYLVHRGDYEIPNNLPDNTIIPNDGDVIEL